MSFNPRTLPQEIIDDLVDEHLAKKKSNAQQKQIEDDLEKKLKESGRVLKAPEPKPPL